MIVQPDFLDHWKTLKLTSVLSDPLAPIYILRLWSYVQTSRRDIIPDDAEMLKAVCRWGGAAPVIRSALVSCGWVDAVEGGLRIHGWSELNARLIHNWTVGKHGGRPRVTMENPRDNPRDSQTKPIRVDKSRGDEKIEGIPSAGVPEKKPAKPSVDLPFASDSFAAVWAQYLEHRTRIRKPMTPYAQKLALAKLPKVEADAVRWINTAIEKGWQGIYNPDSGPGSKDKPSTLPQIWIDPKGPNRKYNW